MSLTPLMALESKDYMAIDLLVKSCYQDIRSCDKSLFRFCSGYVSLVLNFLILLCTIFDHLKNYLQISIIY